MSWLERAEIRRCVVTALLVTLAVILKVALGLPEEGIQLLDSQGNPLPPYVEEHLHFCVGNKTYATPDFKALFNSASIISPNLTVFYSFLGVNWSLKHEVVSNSSIILHMRRLGNIAFRIRSADTQFRWGFETLTLNDLVVRKAIPGLNIIAQNVDSSLSFENCEPSAYFPLANASGAPYSWRLVAVFLGSLVLNESLSSLWEEGIADLALAKIPKDLNLGWITGWCSEADVQATIICGEKVLRNSPSSTFVSVQSAWFYPTNKNCSVHLIFSGREKICNVSILELGKCRPEIYPVEVKVTGASSYEPVEVKADAVDVRIDGKLLDLHRPRICLWGGVHTLELRYNLDGRWVVLMERNFTLEDPATLPIQINFSRIEVYVHGCAYAPQVLVNGVSVHVEKRGAAHVTTPIPVMDANVTVKVCNITFSLEDIKIKNTSLIIELPTVTNLEFEHPRVFPLLVLLALILIQIALTAYAWIATRRL